MDLLAKELARKKQALQKAKDEAKVVVEDSSSSFSKTKKKYLKLADVRRLEEEEEEREQLRLQEEERRRKRNLQDDDSSEAKTSSNNNKSLSTDVSIGGKTKKFKSKKRKTNSNSNHEEHNDTKKPKDGHSDSSPSTSTSKSTKIPALSSAELSKQLRSFGLPIRLFGETPADRQQRLDQAIADQTKRLQGLSEKEEFKLGQGHGIRNPFLEKQEDADIEQNDKPNKTNADDEKEEEVVDASDPPKYIYKYFKGLLKQWEQDLAERPESVRKTAAGKTESKTVKQCKDYIRPLFKLCKNRRLEDNMQAHLMKIVLHAQDGEFVKAHDAYLDVAIGK